MVWCLSVRGVSTKNLRFENKKRRWDFLRVGGSGAVGGGGGGGGSVGKVARDLPASPRRTHSLLLLFDLRIK